MFTKTTLFHKSGEGGGSSGDQHNLGWYATPEALRTAHATATAGDWAIVGSTDTVWVWDTDTSAWKDSDQKGQVASVNGQTGTVVLTASDVDAVPQLSTLPTASADNVGVIVQFVGTTTASYTNGYFYKCVSDGQNPATYSWEEVEVQASSGGLPDQTGNAGKFLTTDGTDASWSDKPLVNNAIGTHEYSIGGIHTTYASSYANAVALGYNSEAKADSVAIGYNAKATNIGVSIGSGSSLGSNGSGYGIAIGYNASSDVNPCIVIGKDSHSTSGDSTVIGTNVTNSGFRNIVLSNSGNKYPVSIPSTVREKFIIGFQGNYYEMLDGTDGTIPEARLADTTNAQQGDVLTLDSNGNAIWQAGSSGGVSDVTVNGTSVVSGGVAAITGMVKNWGSNGGLGIGSTGYATANAAYSIAIGNGSSATRTAAIAIGFDTQSEAMFSLCVGHSSYVNQLGGIAIGYGAKVYAEKAIQLGYFASNADANTFKVSNANGNFEMMSADGTIPAARHAALPSADGTYVLKLVIADGVPTLSWVAE